MNAAMSKALRSRPTMLYRAYDAAGVLLYVGITKDVDQRLREHRMTTSWCRDEMARVEIEEYPNRDLAHWAEFHAITIEAPKHNRQAQAAEVRSVATKLPEYQHRALREAARQEGCSIPELLSRLITEHLASLSERED